jgi:hypothetical protein
MTQAYGIWLLWVLYYQGCFLLESKLNSSTISFQNLPQE